MKTNEESARPGNRKRLAELLRQLASGQLSNDDFEDAYLDAIDRQHDAAWEVYEFAWCFYSDLYEHRLRATHRLSPMQRRVFARCVLFLRSGLPYEWDRQAKWLWCRQRGKPEPSERVPWWKPDALVLHGLPIWGRRLKEWQYRREEAADRKCKERGIVDDRIWPFRRMADYKAVLKNPPYLAGCAAG